MTAPGTSAEAIDQLVAAAEVADDRAAAAQHLYRAATLAGDGAPGRALTLLDQALVALADDDQPRLRGAIALLASELAYDAGDAAAGAAASVGAERWFTQAADLRGQLAVEVARALRCLRGGDPAVGVAMVTTLLPVVDALPEPGPRTWLRLYGADALLAAGQLTAALPWLVDVLETSDDANPRLVATELIAVALTTWQRPVDAARVAAAALADLTTADPALRAQQYRNLAVALATIADGPLAELCAVVAANLATVPPPPTTPPAVVVVSPLLL